MKEQEIRTELLEEEVNVYLGGCGDVQYMVVSTHNV